MTSVVGGVANFGWGMALGLSLSLVSLVSLLTVAAVPRRALGLTVNRARGRAFKGGSISASLRAGTAGGRTAVQFDVVTVPKGLEASLEGGGAERVLTATSRFAGVFSGFEVKVGVTDPLGIFVRSYTHEVDLGLEFLPTLLLARNEPMTVAATILGDLPAGRSGFGQEFYSAEVYNTSSSSKDIMWKREAKLPSDRLFVRVGEANIPERLTVCLIELKDVVGRETPLWMDLVSEAIARIGVQVLATGSAFRLVHTLEGRSKVKEAKDPAGLANLIVWLWRKDIEKEDADGRVDGTDIIMAAQADTQDPQILGLILEKPSVVLSWGRRNPVLGSNVVFFTGREDISGLVAKVLSK
jgi:hypothetical protein